MRNRTALLGFVVTPLALLFAGLGVQFWIAPERAARQFGLEAVGAAGLVALRADLGGLFLGLALLCGVGAWWQQERPWLGAAAVVLLAVAAGRTLGWIAGGGAGVGFAELGVELAGAAVLIGCARTPKTLPAPPARSGQRSAGSIDDRRTNREIENTMHNWIAPAVMLIWALAASAPAPAARVKYDCDREADFSQWEKAAWQRPDATGASLAEGRIRRALEAGFEARGYAWVEAAQEADFLVAYHAAARRDLRLEESLRGPGLGRDLRVDSLPVGTLVVDLFDRATGKLAWRGLVSDALASDPEKAEKKTAKAIAKLLEKFPSAGDGPRHSCIARKP